jgi:hypothetical protein
MTEGLVFTVEPFLSLGADYAESGGLRELRDCNAIVKRSRSPAW